MNLTQKVVKSLLKWHCRQYILILLVLGMAILSSFAAQANDDIKIWKKAIIHNRIDVLQRLTQQRFDIHVTNDAGKTALMAAARKGAVEFCKTLIERGARVNQINENGGTALMHAAANGNTDTLGLLLKHGAAINAQGANGWSAMLFAAAKGHIAAVELLSTAGGDINVRDLYGWTPLMRAAENHQMQIAQNLINHSEILIDAQNDFGSTALHRAAANGFVDFARMLLNRGAKTDIKDKDGYTPKKLAQRLGHTQIVELLSI